jgi:hypothetical protein
MTKKQEEIYKWLSNNQGYIKKGLDWLMSNSFRKLKKIGWTGVLYKSDLEIALKQARKDFSIKEESTGVKIDKKLVKELVKRSEEKLGKLPIEKNPILFTRKVVVDKETGMSVHTLVPTNPYYNPNNVLVIPDLHLPFARKGIMEHCLEMQKKYNCGTVVLIGDEVDLCAVSQWEKDPDGFSAGTEAEMAQTELKKWYKAFPTAYVCIGNHTARPFRMAKANGIPKKFIKSYEEAWEAPNTWKWAEHWEFNGVLYTHGTGFSGANAAITIASMHRQNTVIGHIHSFAGIQYNVSKKDIVWGMMVGGAIDDKSYAAHYAKDQLKKSIVGCGIVINGKLPIYEPMIL